MNKLIGFINKNKYILLIFLLATLFFIAQHFLVFSWDFISYVLNAKHLFNGGLYFETFRPPLTSLLIGVIAQCTGYATAEIVYILLVSILFCIGSLLLAGLLNFNKEIFYLLLLTPIVLFYGLLNGTELLFLTFLIFGIYFILKNNWASGLFLGFAALTRYAGIVFGVLLLFNKGICNKIKAILIFIVTFIPWGIYNYVQYGNFFTSIADQYFQNVISRIGIEQTPKLIHFIYNQSLLLVLTVIGLCFVIYSIFKSKQKINKLINLKVSIMMLFILFCTIYSYFSIPFKDARYLFAIALPIGYFTYIGLIIFITWLRNKHKQPKYIRLSDLKKLYWVLIILLLVLSFGILYTNYSSDKYLNTRYSSAVDIINSNNLQNCLMYSNNWIFFTYIDNNVVLLPIEVYFNDLSTYTQKVLFLDTFRFSQNNKKVLESNFQVIYKKESFLVLGNFSDCLQQSDYSTLFYNIFKSGVSNNQNNLIYTDPCEILFNKYTLFKKGCDYFNYNLFN